MTAKTVEEVFIAFTVRPERIGIAELSPKGKERLAEAKAALKELVLGAIEYDDEDTRNKIKELFE